MADIQFIFSICAAFVFAGFLIFAAMSDVRSFTITNRLNIIFAACFLVFFLPIGLGFTGLALHIGVAITAFAIGFVLFMTGAFGGGDAKLIAATALWLGPNAMLAYAINTALAGGVLAIVLLIARFAAKKFGLPRKPRWARQLLRKRAQVPYGVALCVGGLLALTRASWYQNIHIN